jgi:hypothetical protein
LPDDHPETVSRNLDVERFAEQHELRYTRHVDEAILDPRYYLFSVGTGDVVGVGDDMVEGRWGDLDIVAFDFRGVMIGMSTLTLVDVGAEGYRYAVSVAITDIDPDIPYIYVEHKDLWVRIADQVEHLTHLPHPHLEVLTGRADFDDEFDVRSAFPDRAKQLLGAGLADAMLEDGRGFAFEVGYGRLLTYEAYLPVEQWPRLFEAAQAFVRHARAAAATTG